MPYQLKEETRSALIKGLSALHNSNEIQISGNRTLRSFLFSIWQLSKNENEFLFFNMEYAGEDMNYYDFFSSLLMKKSDEIFFKFLEEIVSPLYRKREEQEFLVNKINDYLSKDGFMLSISEEEKIEEQPVYKVLHSTLGVKSEPRLLVFAAHYKPDSPNIDLKNNDIIFKENIDNYLIFKEGECGVPSKYLNMHGLSWEYLVNWWKIRTDQPAISNEESAVTLYERLYLTVQKQKSRPEEIFWTSYFNMFCQKADSKYPVLIPQVYFFYNPKTLEQLDREVGTKRMDFLLLLPRRVHIVIEIDGKQHYSKNSERLFEITQNVIDKLNEKIPDWIIKDIVEPLKGLIRQKEEFCRDLKKIKYEPYKRLVLEESSYKEPCPQKYAEMLKVDRQLRLDGYEVYRFGGYEIREGNEIVIEEFFTKLFQRHGIPEYAV